MLIFARTLDRHASRPLSCRANKVAQRPGCWLSGGVKATKQVAVCILKFLSFKRHTCSHLFLTRLVICLYSTPSGDLWFLLKKKSQRKAHGLCYKVAWESTASERIILRCTYMCWKNRLLRNSISLPTRKLWWRRCYFENDSIVDCCGVEDNSFLKTETYRRQWAKLA